MAHEVVLVALSIVGGVAGAALYRRGRKILSLVLLVAMALLAVFLASRWHISLENV